jgi:TolB protein
MYRLSLAAVVLVTLAAAPAASQDTTTRGVRIGLRYDPGSKPGVAVLPVGGAGGDSVRVILQRDLDFGDRVTVIGSAGTSSADAVRGAAGASLNYPLFAQLGAAAIVSAVPSAGGLSVTLHDVAAKRVLNTAEFRLPGAVSSPEWRMAAHGIADQLEQWITGTRGIAQTRIAYVSQRRIRVADSDGENDREVSDAGTVLSPNWHPNGRYLVYSQLGPRGSQVLVRDLQALRSRVLSSATGGLNITPIFSPDGQTIVYAHGGDDGTDLMIADTDGGPARRITIGRGTDNVSPTFSPDGRRIAFTSGRSGHPEVYLMDADGTNAELLTPFAFGDQYYRSNPDWSPDGRTIAFQSQLGGVFQVMTISLRDRSVKQLTSEGRNEDPSWAPDGRHLVFTSTRAGTPQLFVLDVESGRTRQLTKGAGARLPAWSARLQGAK